MKVQKKVSNKKETNQQIEKASQILESFGPFQIFSVIMLCPIYVMMGMTITNPVFLNMVPDHHCQQNNTFDTVSLYSMRILKKKEKKYSKRNGIFSLSE